MEFLRGGGGQKKAKKFIRGEKKVFCVVSGGHILPVSVQQKGKL